ncbi:MAG: hypothetical protein WB683_05115 [Candidatus Sulfotelmatobacter sp.]
MTPYISPVELIFRQLSQPKPQDAKPAPVAEPSKAELTRADVDAIIQRKRAATPEELQEILACVKLTSGERNQLSVDLTVMMAQRSRRVNSKCEDPSAKLIHELGYAETPFGLLYERAWFQKEFQTGTKAIAECRSHRPPHCSCWRETRESLWYVRSSFPERSPESLTALRIWEALEELEFATRPERSTR